MSEVIVAPAVSRLLLTIDQAAECLQISRASLYREVQRGRLKVVKLGHLSRIRIDDLDAYVSELTLAGAAR